MIAFMDPRRADAASCLGANLVFPLWQYLCPVCKEPWRLSSWIGCELLEQAAVLLKVAVAEELIDGTLACVGGEPRRLGPVADERLDRGTEGGKIGRLVDEQAVLVIVDLVDDAANRARDDRPRVRFPPAPSSLEARLRWGASDFFFSRRAEVSRRRQSRHRRPVERDSHSRNNRHLTPKGVRHRDSASRSRPLRLRLTLPAHLRSLRVGRRCPSCTPRLTTRRRPSACRDPRHKAVPQGSQQEHRPSACRPRAMPSSPRWVSWQLTFSSVSPVLQNRGQAHRLGDGAVKAEDARQARSRLRCRAPGLRCDRDDQMSGQLR
jgi:hypothetical protein